MNIIPIEFIGTPLYILNKLKKIIASKKIIKKAVPPNVGICSLVHLSWLTSNLPFFNFFAKFISKKFNIILNNNEQINKLV
jgi:hypothetical protein